MFHDPIESERALFSDDEREAAGVLLSGCIALMTGREIEICERIASTGNDDFDPFSLTAADLQWFASLQIQFARDIAVWKNGRCEPRTVSSANAEVSHGDGSATPTTR